MSPRSAKQKIREAIDKLPADATLEDAIERLVLLAKTERGEERVFYDVTHETVEVLAIVTKAEAARWLAEHGTPDAPGGSG